jgi:ABC-type transport system involved in cytochrome bd biosynthesis fused ATPase/permease subunit
MENKKPAMTSIDPLDIYWNKFKERYWSIVATAVVLIIIMGIFHSQLSIWVYIISIVLLMLGMAANVGWCCFKLSNKTASLLNGLFGFLLFSLFPIAQMAIYFAVEKEYLNAKGLPVPKYIKICYWLGIILGSIFLLSVIRSI